MKLFEVCLQFYVVICSKSYIISIIFSCTQIWADQTQSKNFAKNERKNNFNTTEKISSCLHNPKTREGTPHTPNHTHTHTTNHTETENNGQKPGA